MAGVELKGFDKVDKRINEMLKRTRNQAPAFKVIKQQGVADVLRHFKDESGPDGKWKPSQRAIKKGGKTLQKLGRLRGATIGKLGINRAIIENSVDYGSYHNDGKGKMPKRKFMWLSDKVMKLMTKTLARFIMEGK